VKEKLLAMRPGAGGRVWGIARLHVIPKGVLDQDPDQESLGETQPENQETNLVRWQLPLWTDGPYSCWWLRHVLAHGGIQTVSGHEQVRIPKTTQGGKTTQNSQILLTHGTNQIRCAQLVRYDHAWCMARF
jgi:hypothetical protein